MREFLMERKKHIVWVTLASIILIGAFLRLYHFSDWLHFELDQARDVLFFSSAVTGGLGELPILGPKASGTALRVGPAFYYLEYASALLFGNTPQGHALFVRILSIVSIGLLYVLMRRFFPVAISLGLTYLYAIGAFFVLHQRFAWNPNILPFFLIAGLLAFFRALHGSEKYPGWWLFASSVLLVIATQLHFVAFFAIPFFVVVTLLIKRPRFSWKVWVVSFAVVPAVLYFPFFVNEWAFEGSNTKAFLSAMQSKKESEGILTQMATNILTQSKAYTLILSGNESLVLPSIAFDGVVPKVKCADYCRKTSDWVQILSIAFFFVGMGLLLWHAFRKADDMRVMALWFLAIFITFTGIASQLAPRFFPLLVPLPYIFLGLVLLQVYKRWRKFFWGVFAVVMAVFTYSNFALLFERAGEMQMAGEKNVSISTDRILEEPVRVTYEQQEAIAKYLAEEYQKNKYPVLIDSESFWRRSIKYIAEREYGVSIGFLFPTDAYARSNNYIILRTKKDGKSVFEKYAEWYTIEDKKEFGTLSVYTMKVKESAILRDGPDIKPILETDGGDIARITWKDAWGKLRIRN